MRNMMMAAGAGVFAVMVAGCGNAVTTSTDGQAGLMKAANGDVIALVKTCSGSITKIEATGSREGLAENKTNPELGNFVASSPQSGVIHVNLSHPQAPWSAKTPLSMPKAPTKTLSVNGANRDKDSETEGVWVTPAQLAHLRPGKVLVTAENADATSMASTETTEAAFIQHACSK